jgi:hypothetical protein
VITRNQKIIIAVLIPLAVVFGFFAVKRVLDRQQLEAEWQKHLEEKEMVEKGRYKVEPKKETEGQAASEPVKEEYPKLYLPREVAGLPTVKERNKLADDMLDFLSRADTKPAERYRAYRTLINCRESAALPLYKSLDLKDPLRLYYTLKACADLKSLYSIDVSQDRSFAEAATRVGSDAAPDVRMQLARLLGYYKDKMSLGRLEKLASDEDPGVRYQALVSLARVGGPSGVPVAAAALQSDEPAILAAACRALTAIVAYDVGAEFISLHDYKSSLQKEVAKWRKWWEDNKAAYEK